MFQGLVRCHCFSHSIPTSPHFHPMPSCLTQGCHRITDHGVMVYLKHTHCSTFLLVRACFTPFSTTSLSVKFNTQNIAAASLRRVNVCGCYKVTDSGRRYLLSVNPRLLTYNRAREFGVAPPTHQADQMRAANKHRYAQRLS